MQRAECIQPLHFVCKVIIELEVILSFTLPCAETNRAPVFRFAFSVLFVAHHTDCTCAVFIIMQVSSSPVLFFDIFVQTRLVYSLLRHLFQHLTESIGGLTMFVYILTYLFRPDQCTVCSDIFLSISRRVFEV